MILQEILRRIKFKVGTTDDISGRAINPIVNNRNIIDELNSQIRQYANITKGIQDIYSFPLNQNEVFVNAPELALRSESYFYLQVIVNGITYAMDMRGQKDVYRYFISNPISGIPSWFMPFKEGSKTFLSVFPQNSTAPKTATLTALISKEDITIPVSNTDGFIATNGRITIKDEKIKYQYKDSTNFYGCLRGLEFTTAKYHESSSVATENNVIIYYSRLHNPIIVNDDDLITQDVLKRDVEVVEEHMEGIIKAVAYNLLIKIDNQRAVPYKLDYIALYEQYKTDIKRNFYAGRDGTNVANTCYQNEIGLQYGSGCMY